MNNESGRPDESKLSPSSLRARKLAPAIAALSLVVGTTGCVVYKTAPESVQASIEPSANQIVNACEWNIRQDTTIQKELARRCLKDIEASRIAIVDYDYGYNDFNEFLEKDLKRVTSGIIDLPIDLFPANEQARNQLSALTPNGCLTKENKMISPVIAEQYMPELQNYDKILTSTKQPYCDIDPITGSGSGGLAAANEGRIATVTSLEDGPSYENLSAFAGHELLHLFGLGHLGDMVTINQDNSEIWLPSTSDSKERHVTVEQYITSNEYREYAPRENPDVIPMFDDERLAPVLAPAQKYVLEWQKRELGMETSVGAYPLHPGGVDISMNATYEPFVMTFKLDQTVHITTNITSKEQEGFISKQLDIEQYVIASSGENKVRNMGLTLYAQTTNRAMIEISTLYPARLNEGEGVILSFETADIVVSRRTTDEGVDVSSVSLHKK